MIIDSLQPSIKVVENTMKESQTNMTETVGKAGKVVSVLSDIDEAIEHSKLSTLLLLMTIFVD